MPELILTAGRTLFSPAVWMALAGMLLMKTGMHQLSSVSMPYMDGLSSPFTKPLGRHFAWNVAIAVPAVIVSYSMDVVLSIDTLIVLWASMLFMQAVKAMPASAFLSALTVIAASRLVNIHFTPYDVLITAILSQMFMGMILLLDEPDTYPSIAKQKDGSIKGVHHHYKVWFMPVFAYHPSLAALGYQTLFMLFYFINAKFTKETYRQYKDRNGIFMLSLSGAAGIAALLTGNYNAVIIAGGAAAIIWSILEKIRSSRAEDLFLPAENGVRVLYVNPGGVGHRAGIMPGDIIISLNNSRVMNTGGIESFFSNTPPHVFVEIMRNRKTSVLEYKDYQNGIDGLDCSYIPRKPVRYQLPED